MCKWWVQLAYNYQHNSYNFRIMQFQPQINIFAGNNNPSSIKPIVARVKISKKININFFQFENSWPVASKQKETYLPQEKWLKTLKDMIIGTVVTHLLKSFTISQNGRNNGVDGIWAFDVTRSISK